MAGRDTPFPRFGGASRGEQTGWVPLEAGDHEVVGRLRMELRPGPAAGSEARHSLDRLDGALPEEQLNELRLLVTELVTNSVRHGVQADGWIELEVEIFANAVRVVVSDTGPGFDAKAAPRPHGDRPGGWGLCLVDQLADRWGVERGGHTSVWFEVDRDPMIATT